MQSILVMPIERNTTISYMMNEDALVVKQKELELS